MFDYKLVVPACTQPSWPPSPQSVMSVYTTMPGPGTGHLIRTAGGASIAGRDGPTLRLSDLYISELARDVRWHVGAANAYTRRQALLLIPPAAALNRREKPQMLSVSEDAHGELPESDYRQEQTQFHDCDDETEAMKTIVLRLQDNGSRCCEIAARASYMRNGLDVAPYPCWARAAALMPARRRSSRNRAA